MSLPPGLGPQCVGQRVVVRRLLRGRLGPSGGPAMTDLLGVMESWTDQTTVVRAEDGTRTEIAVADLVSGKPVPPRPSPRLRVTPEDACRRSNASWPAVHTAPLGGWLLRASGGFTARANSVMATGDPGVPFTDALEQVRRFYAEHGLPAWAQVVLDTPTAQGFDEAGWVTARPDNDHCVLQIGSVAQAARAVRRLLPGSTPPVAVADRATAAWLANDERARTHREDALAVLEGPEPVAFVSVGDPDGPVLAKGRVACSDASSDWSRDWVGITDVWVHPDHRRRGLASVVLDELLGWAAERGASTVYLQVRAENAPALGLYAAVGLRVHHAYRYLTAAPQEQVTVSAGA